MKKMIFLFFVILTIFISGCTYYDELIVKYTVSGTSGDVTIVYAFGNELITLDTVSLPWEYEYKLWADLDDSDCETQYNGYLSAERNGTGDNSEIELSISVDGEIRAETSFIEESGSASISVDINLNP